ncbi:extracellular solute-binding protein [Frigidibacter sp. RF13]|uniref:extracellular solute-binding protein n=1 Tax=Frigidibacter sp. RF13 TaxID=2997340 RepID=UPI0022721EED|nr:extracellular solute-binding protein [Frigidibacter sp. RF13]MCY1125577.1 extracellular solute-binding protein [Frigidibacter sp. RF13]
MIAMVALLGAGVAVAEPKHGIAMYGEPALPPDFVALPYANPDAPKGGTLRFGEPGGFDSLNPFSVKGTTPYGITIFTIETLMGRSMDEPFSLYGRLAESIETDEDRTWVEFTLRPEAKFSDGSPVTAEDVIWSFETLGTVHPRYAGAWKKVEKIEKTGERKVRITFNVADRELALLMGLRPVLKKADWEGRNIEESSMEVPIGSGPYVIDAVDPGKRITYRRNPDYWGKDLPFNRGQNNLDVISYDYFGDGDVIFQAFTAGETDSFREFSAKKWATAYDVPLVASGDVIKEEIPHQRPSGIEGLVMNSRSPVFADWRVREAMILAFNFEFINQTVNGGTEPRITSYFSNSVLGTDHGPAAGKVAELLQPFAADLPPGTIEGYDLPVADPSKPTDRGNIRKALVLMEEAGWTVSDGVMKGGDGKPFTFEIVLAAGSTDAEAAVNIYLESLKQLGITPTVTMVDGPQYKERTNNFAYDMTWIWRTLSLSPGNEQALYWGTAAADSPGSRNWMGAKSPAIDAMIAAMVGARSTEDFTAATQALDRALLAGRYVIPVWYSKVSRLAYSKHLHHPDRIPLYGDWPGFQPDVWWYEE